MLDRKPGSASIPQIQRFCGKKKRTHWTAQKKKNTQAPRCSPDMVPCTAETGSCSKTLIAYCKPQLRWLRWRRWLRCTLCLSEAHVQTLRLCTQKHFIDRLTPISTQHLRSLLQICVFTPQNPSRSKGANRSSCLVFWMFHPLSSLSCRLVGWWGGYSIWQQKCSSGSSNWGPQDVSAQNPTNSPRVPEMVEVGIWISDIKWYPSLGRCVWIYSLCAKNWKFNPSPPPRTPSIGHLQLHENCQNH